SCVRHSGQIMHVLVVSANEVRVLRHRLAVIFECRPPPYRCERHLHVVAKWTYWLNLNKHFSGSMSADHELSVLRRPLEQRQKYRINKPHLPHSDCLQTLARTFSSV